MTGNVEITGTPTVLVGNSVTIGSLPAVSFSGTPTVAISGTVPVTGNMEITGTPTVLVGNSVTIGSLPAVSFSGTPTVAISGTVPVSGTVGNRRNTDRACWKQRDDRKSSSGVIQWNANGSD